MHQCSDNSQGNNSVCGDPTSRNRDCGPLRTLWVWWPVQEVQLSKQVEMLSGKLLLCAVLIAVWPDAESASVPFVPLHVAGDSIPRAAPAGPRATAELGLAWPKVREGVPPPLCAGRCASPPAGPVCAFDAAGTARTFATLCELEAVSCRESTYYAIASLGEC